MTLVPVDRSAESVVTVNAKAWLSTAVEMTGPEEIAAAKAQMRALTTAGWTRKALGQKYGVNPATVSGIVRNIWRTEVEA
jgi:hypothetical protein